ncbi:DNA-binding protein YbiB [Rhodoferax sp. AJA081-3]|uniref:DNA-binding protein YbiB n=1 Tax=Rhodoferax sp. AJA081-3 TaxID=2752316 RepID=UPI001ADF8578|nr:DNA-binding protein YbiB [Rhodoferax sp. AJA081-3]QTN28263.1 DNA-binding protein YbiB [Rhodoferax sp. AJA081-3]
MGIAHYIKEIGRGSQGARPLNREQATDLFGQVLDGAVTDLEVGAFCLAMRIKGETAQEMAGFLDATHQRLHRLPASTGRPTIVIPSYNGARKLPVLTPLLALLLAREGLPVLVHGTATESRRVYTSEVLLALAIPAREAIESIAPGTVAFVPTALLHGGLQRLLDVRRVVGLRNPAHSLVKLMSPVEGKSLLVSSYTHPEYAVSMAETLAVVQGNALLLRGTEGEAVADPRRTPKMQGFINGEVVDQQAHQDGTLTTLPDLPPGLDAASTAAYIRSVLDGTQPVPTPIAQQVAHILHLVDSL